MISQQSYKFDGGTMVDECSYATKRRLAANEWGDDEANVISK